MSRVVFDVLIWGIILVNVVLFSWGVDIGKS